MEDRSASAAMRPFFEPEGVVLVGARRTPGFGYGIPVMLKKQGWSERLRLVNPAGGELHGLLVYPSVADAPDPVDLGVVIVPSENVPGVLDELGRRNVRHVIVESAGFAEVGREGRLLQERALSAARNHGMRVIGPNCVGVVNTANRLTTVELIEEALRPGATSIIAQSGVFGNVLLDLLHEYRLFIAKAVTLGNRMDVDECDMLDFLSGDPATRVIMVYLEGAADGIRLKRTLENVSRRKPVVVLKSGRTSTGMMATASHTGSMSGEDAIYDAVFAQTGAVRALNLEELVETARVFSSQPVPAGNRLGVITSSGSLGVMATDTAVSRGLELPGLSGSTVRALRREAPAWMNVRNPLDVGPSGLFARGLEALMGDPAIDMVLAITIIPYAVFREFKAMGAGPRDWFGDICSLRKSAPEKPFVVCAVGHREFVDEVRELCGDEIPVFVSPEPAAKALAVLYRRGRWFEEAVP